MTRIVVLGDALVDLDVVGRVDRVGPEGCVVLEADDERRRPGGAALAATFAATDGADVTFVTALGDDEAAQWLRRSMQSAGVEVVDLGLDGPTPQKWRLRSTEGTLLRVDRDCDAPAAFGGRQAAVRRALRVADAVLVADYGRGVAAASRRSIDAVVDRVAIVWDPHPRGPAPPPGVDLVTPNEREAQAVVGRPGASPTVVAAELATLWSAAVAVTCGGAGAVLAEPGRAVVDIPAAPAAGDTCGAGDRLAAHVTVARAGGASRVAAVTAGVAAATRYVATGITGPPVAADDDAVALAAAVRQRGGTVVTAGGCFDLLHAGHVQLLQSARALGDCLIVCLNSDASVSRLKGPRRPVVGQADRRRVLEALACVDAVAVFDEDTPTRLLERIRPHVFAKGADYDANNLPERAVVDRWGGRVAILPLSDGRSTSRLIELVREEAS